MNILRRWPWNFRSTKRKPLVSTRRDVLHVQKLLKKRVPSVSQFVHVHRVLSSRERTMMRFGLVGIACSFFLFGLAMFDANRMVVPAQGGVYTEAIVGSVASVNPLFSQTNEADQDIARLVYSGLMRYDSQGRLVHDLAASHELSEDGATYTFTLRNDVVWHDGSAFTARDVVFTIERIQDEQTGTPLRFAFQGVTVSAEDDDTVVFTLTEPYRSFLSVLTVGVLPYHRWKDIPPAQMKQSALNLQPVGTGPFQFSRLVQQDTGYVSRYELARNPAFYRVPAFLDEVHVQFYGTYDDGGIESLTNPIQALREQKVDGLHFVPPELREQVERKHIVLHTAVLPQYVGVFFNQNRNPLLQEPVVREALEVALDKQRLMREATDGDGTIMNGPILPGFPGYSYEEPVPGSIVKANELLDEYYDRKNADEYRADERDARIALRMDQLADTATSTPSSTIRAEIEFLVDQELSSELNETQLFYRVDDEDMLLELALVTVDTEEYRVGATIIAAAWEELGIKTTVTYIDPALFRTDVLQRRSYDALLYGVIVGADPDQYAFWHSDNTQHPGLNLAQYVNREVDTIIEQTQATTDADELDTLYQSFATTLQEDRPAIFLYTPTYTYATTDRIQGVHTERMYVPADRYASITDWYIKTKKVFRP